MRFCSGSGAEAPAATFDEQVTVSQELRSARRASPLSGDTTSSNCVASINRYAFPIRVLYTKKMMPKKRFIRDLSRRDSPIN